MTVALNEQQATKILIEGTARGLYENGGKIPSDPKVLLRDATELVEAAEKASRAKNKSENVEAILFIAQVDMKPILPDPTAQIAPEVEKDNTYNGLDLTTLAPGILEQLIIGLDAYPQTEKVEQDRKAYVGEVERRANAQAGKSQEIASAASGGEAAQEAREIAPEGPAAADASTGQPTAPTEGPNSGGFAPDGGTGRSIGSTDVNASAFARAQTPETTPEGKVPKASKVEENGERSAIEEELTLPMCKAHGIELSKIPYIPIDKLRYIVVNPNGPEKDTKMPVNESEVESSAISSNIKGISVGGIATDVPVPEAVVTKEDLGIAESIIAVTPGGLSPEREKLEGLVTGPMLKAYGRGRKEIPSIGDNELRFMILNEDGKVSPDELEAARAKDINNPLSEPSLAEDDAAAEYAAEIEEKAGPEAVEKARQEAIENSAGNAPQSEIDNSVTAAEAYTPAVEDNAIAEYTAEVTTAIESIERVTDIVGPEVAAEAIEIIDQSQRQSGGRVIIPDGQSEAIKIIVAENMPTPPNYSEENTPQFPMDVSLCSRDELFSLHARFHAYETRMNWILSGYEEEVNDYIKLRNYREAVVAKEMSFMGEDGKRNTNEYRDTLVRGDKEVLELGMKEHEKKKIVTDLKVLRNNYHLDCERLSRQMSKYEQERIDAPR